MKLFNYLVVVIILCTSYAYAGESRIYAQRVDDDGTKLGNAITIYSAASGAQSEARISFYNDRYLVVWNEFNGSDIDVKGARIAMDGTVIDTTPLDIASGARTQAMPDVDADGSGWVVAYHGFDGTDVFPTVYAIRVDYDGTVHNETPAEFGHPGNYGAFPRIIYDSNEGKHLLAYTSLSSYTVTAQYMVWELLNTSLVGGGLTDSAVAISTGDQFYEFTPYPTGTWGVIVSGASPRPIASNRGVYAGHIEADGVFDTDGYGGGNPAYISESAAYNLDSNDWPYGGVDIATDATYLIGVWTRYHKGVLVGKNLTDGDIYATRIDDDGFYVGSQGGTAIAIESGVGESNPNLAGDSAGTLLVVYDKDTDGSIEIYGRILTVTTGISAGSEIEIRSDSSGGRRGQSAVAYGVDGGTTEFMVVWTEGWWGAL